MAEKKATLTRVMVGMGEAEMELGATEIVLMEIEVEARETVVKGMVAIKTVEVDSAEVETAEVETAQIDSAEVKTAEMEAAEVEMAEVEVAEVETAGVEITEVETVGVEGREMKMVEMEMAVVEEKEETAVEELSKLPDQLKILRYSVECIQEVGYQPYLCRNTCNFFGN